MNWPRYKSLITEELITAMFFAVLVFGLGVLSISRWTIGSRTIAAEEKRWLAAFPHIHWNIQSMTEFPAGFNEFYNDRFALRKYLIAGINLAKYKAFDYSSSDKVLVGKKDWLFFFDGGDEETLRGYPLLTHAELENWVRVLEARRAWLAARNIRYFLFMPPSKCTIYREYTPCAYTCLNKLSRLDQLNAALVSNSHVDFLDIRSLFMQAKNVVPLYFKTDTHWNRMGAFVAYQAVIQHLKKWFPAIEPLETKDLKIEAFKYRGGDMTAMMGMPGLIPETVWQGFVRVFKYRISDNPPAPNFDNEAHHTDPFATEIDDPSLPKAFCLRDSFMTAPQWYFSQNFRRIAYYWRYDFPVEVIEAEKPDIVIQEITERRLARGVPYNPPEVNKYAHVELVVAGCPGSVN